MPVYTASCVMVHIHKVSGAAAAFLQRRAQAKGVPAMVIAMGGPLYFSRGYGFRGLSLGGTITPCPVTPPPVQCPNGE
jgi:hypothetical protein